MDFIETAKAISELGFLIICGGLVITFIWIMFKKMCEREDYLITTLNEKQENIIRDIVHQITTHTMSEEDTLKMAQIDDEINEYLKRTLEVTKSNRVSIMMYHNGGLDSIGNPFPRMSMRYEVTNGIPKVMEEMKGMFKSYLHEWCKIMDKQQYYEIKNLDEAKNVSDSFADFMKSRHINALAAIAIRNKNKTTVGFIVIEYVNANDFNLKQVQHCLHDKQLKIEALLGLEYE